MSQSSAETNRYLYEQIYSALKEEILSGKYRKGDWFPPERALKDRFETTHLTVRNALAKLVLEGYIERYSGKGTVVIYARDRAPATRKARIFPYAHLIVESLDDGNAPFLQSLEASLRKVPLPLRLSCHQGDVLLGREMLREAREAGALIILQPFGARDAPAFEEDSVENTVVIRSPVANAACAQVVSDDVEGGRTAVRHLLGMEYRKIALISAGFAPQGGGLRRGLREELASVGAPDGSGIVEPCASGVDGGQRAVRAVLAREPDCRAFLCTTDATAAGALAGLQEAGLRAGQDCAVIGFGNTPLAAGMRLTSIDPRMDLLAERVVAVVLEGMSRGAFTAGTQLVSPELCVRSSSARPAGTP